MAVHCLESGCFGLYNVHPGSCWNLLVVRDEQPTTSLLSAVYLFNWLSSSHFGTIAMHWLYNGHVLMHLYENIHWGSGDKIYYHINNDTKSSTSYIFIQRIIAFIHGTPLTPSSLQLNLQHDHNHHLSWITRKRTLKVNVAKMPFSQLELCRKSV